MTLRLFSIFFLWLVFSVKVLSFGLEIPFTDRFDREAEKSLVISGAGPLGLMAAHMLKDRFDQVLVLENRTKFDRDNTVTLRPEALVRLKEIGLKDLILEHAIFAAKCDFILDIPGHEARVLAEEEEIFESIDYRKKVSDIFAGDGWPFHAIELYRLQSLLAEKLLEDKRVSIVQGQIVGYKKDHNLVAIDINPHAGSDIVSLTPTLLVVAEGAHSTSRELFGIPFAKVDNKPKEYWVGGALDLSSVEKDERIEPRISIHISPSGLVNFGIFRPQSHDIFANVEISKNDYKKFDNDTRFKTGLSQLFAAVNPKGVKETSVLENLPVKKGSAYQFKLEFKKMLNAQFATNTVFIGDSVGNGSPKGGVGLSGFITRGLWALEQYCEHLLHRDDMQTAGKDYNEVMQDIVHYWQFNQAK